MQSIEFEQAGDPSQVLHLADRPEPGAPAGGDVLVEVLFSPVNRHDVAYVKGALGTPAFPAVAGNEGLGRVASAGPQVTSVRPGDLVVLPLMAGAWRERLTLPANRLVTVPDGDRRQLSMLGGNTPTAGLALSEYVTLEPGEWVIQSGANGGVGRNVIALASARGLKTVSVVRRPAAIGELAATGADVILLDGPDLARQIRDATGGAAIRLAIDGVGGQTAADFAAVLAPGGRIVRYASASGEGVDENAPAITRKGIKVEFVFPPRFDVATKIAPVIAEAVPLVESGALYVNVDAAIAFSDFPQALRLLHDGRKVLLHPGSTRRP